ncbi:hypothetical protein PAHAL_7G237900 [Panicum hallii]|uniref:Uncharacterized protein n=1 Tax=Panicum hallii TaxID=206008 RepID=A0A2S3I925_9POAL|nr:hypothetical protein PAHAL_7G237900 [Panicum hallii]
MAPLPPLQSLGPRGRAPPFDFVFPAVFFVGWRTDVLHGVPPRRGLMRRSVEVSGKSKQRTWIRWLVIGLGCSLWWKG